MIRTLTCHIALSDLQKICEMLRAKLCHKPTEALHPRSVPGESIIVISHQSANLIDRIVIKL